jgi:iron complex outermembrane receptor protein
MRHPTIAALAGNKKYTAAIAGGILPLMTITQVADPALAEPQSGPVLEQIMVTAQRREENLQDVPIFVNALTANMLDKAGVKSATDLNLIAPGLVAYQTAAAFLPYIRGVGSSLSQAGFDSSIAVYVDGIYLANKAGNLMELNAIERIEVLKGPQGTLFGRNATGGAINIVTKDPGAEPELNIEASYGNYDQKIVRGYVAVPVSDTLGVSFAISRRWMDGYIYDDLRDTHYGEVDRTSVLGKAVWTPSDQFRVELSASHTNEEDNSSLATHPLPGTLSLPESLDIPVGDAPFGSRFSHDPIVHVKTNAVTLDMSYDFDGVTLQSISGYRDGWAQSFSDTDMSPAPLQYATTIQNFEQYSQELQLRSDNASRLEWIGGLYYIWDKQGYGDGLKGLISARNLPFPFTAADLMQPGASAVGFDTKITTEAWAAFGQASYNFTDADRLTLGLRFTEEQKSVDGNLFAWTPSGGNLVQTFLSSVDKSTTWSKLTWRAAYDHRFSDNLMAYASYNRGFKSGGYNTNTVSPAAVPLNPEILDAFEVGFKGDFFNSQLRLNAAVFYYDYQDIHVQLSQAGTTLTENAGSAELYGIDIDLVAVPTNALTLRAGLNLMDTKYTRYPNASVFVPITDGMGVPLGGNTQVAIDAKGQDTIFSPKFTANLGLDYEIPLRGESRFVFSGSVYYNDGYDVTPGGINSHVGSYENINASITWYARNDRFFIRAWGENLTDNVHAIYISPQATGYQIANNRPRTYGLTIGMSWGD